MATKKNAWVADSEARVARAEKAAAQSLRDAYAMKAKLPTNVELATVDLLAADEILTKARAAAFKKSR